MMNEVLNGIKVCSNRYVQCILWLCVVIVFGGLMIRRMGEFTLKEKKKQKYSELIRMEPVFFVMD